MLVRLERAPTTYADTRSRRHPPVLSRWAWLLPPLVALSVRYGHGRELLAIQVIIGIAVVGLVSRRPDRAILALVVGYPFNTFALSYLYAIGLPAGLVSVVSYWKEATVAGCVLAAVRCYWRGGHRFDRIDWLVTTYGGIVGLYYLFPRLFVHPTDPFAIGPPTDSQALNLGIRQALLFLVLFVAARHLELDESFRDRFARAVFLTGAALAAIGAYEYWLSDSWNDFVVNTVQLPRFRVEVIGVFTGSPTDIRVYSAGAGSAVRIGSVFLDPLLFGTWLIPPLAIGAERLLRGSRWPLVVAGCGVMVVAILLTQTRGAIAGMVIVMAILLRPSPRRQVSARARFLAVGAVALILLAPIVVSSGVLSRSLGTANGAEGSNQDHLTRTRAAFDQLVHEPLGGGLATGPGLGDRLGISNLTNAENYYLQLGNETGVVSAVIFVIVVFLVIGRLRSAREAPDVLAPSWRAAFIALSIVSFIMGLWAMPAVALLVWSGLGIVTPAPRDALASATLAHH